MISSPIVVGVMITDLSDAVYEIVPWHSLNASVDNLSMKLMAVVGQEIQYACRFWASHLGKVELVDEELSREMENFTGVRMGIGKGYLLKWVMVISMMGGVHHAIRSLQGLLPWLVSIEGIRMKILLIDLVCRDH